VYEIAVSNNPFQIFGMREIKVAPPTSLEQVVLYVQASEKYHEMAR